MKFPALIFSVGVLFSVVTMSCQKGQEGDGNTSVPQRDIKQVAYGSDTAMNMDVYLPANRDTLNTKTIVFIHGGSWTSGDKSEFNDAINAIRGNLPDYAIVNINYRLARNSATRFPVQMNDIQTALNFVESKRQEYKINTNKIGLVGASAGAHLALLHAYKNNSQRKVKAVVDLFGPTDLKDMYNNHPIPAEARWVLTNFLGTTPAANSALYDQASPIKYVTAQSVPTLIFHGSDDFIVPLSQSTALKAALQANNVKVEMTTYQLEGHGWLGANLLDTYAKSVKFIKENVL